MGNLLLNFYCAVPGPQHSRKRPAKHCRGGIYAARTVYSALSENTIYSPTAPTTPIAANGKSPKLYRIVPLISHCRAKQNAKEKQCDAF